MSTVSLKSKRKRPKMIGWALLFLLSAYLVVLALLYLTQDHLIFPGRYGRGAAFAQIYPPAGSERLELKTARGEKIAALFGTALSPEGEPLPDPKDRPTLLYFYGNGDSIGGSLDLFGEFRRMGANVLIADYVGYGMSEGRPSELGCYATADAAYDYLLTRNDVNPDRIVIVGYSLGGAVAIDLASRKPSAGLATFSTFTSMNDMARLQYPFLYFPPPVFRHPFSSRRKMEQITCPVLLTHGDKDGLIPFVMRDRLAEAYRGEPTLLKVEGANHVDVFTADNGKALSAIRQFINNL